MNYRNLWIFFLFGILLYETIECKRSGGRSRSTNSRGFSLWSSNGKKKSNTAANKPATPVQPNAELASLSYPKQTGNTPINAKPKPSAPRLETQNVQKSSISNTQTANKQIVNPPVNSAGQNAPAPGAAPIGWNVPPNQANHGSQLQTKTFQQNQQNSPPQYPANYGAPVNTQYGNSAPSYGNTGYGGPAYGNTGSGVPAYGNPGYGNYGSHQATAGNYYNGGQTAYNPSGQSYNPQQPFQGYYPSANVGVIPPRGQNAGNYYNSMAGIPNTPSFANHGGYGGGTFGSLAGGQKHSGYGYGGYGGSGGYGGMGGFGSGGLMNQKRGFGSGFAGTAFTSLATGLLVWSIMRGGRSQNYNVYNHYNNPEAVPQEIQLPANVITLCSENSTMLCAPNTVPLCTSSETIFCVVTAAATIPCQDVNGSSCVDTTLPCTADCGEGKENTTLTLPCIANATVSGTVTLQNDPGSQLFTQNASETTLCVTTMAMPAPAEEQAAVAAAPVAPAAVAPAPNNMTDLVKPDTLRDSK